MRVFAIHDAAGIISEVVTCPEDSPLPVLTTHPALSMTEIEIPADVVETKLESSQGLTKLIENYRVQVVPGKTALVSR
jgi:hypothetical protein